VKENCKKLVKNLPAPPCLGEALRWGTLMKKFFRNFLILT
jgi:hypothetical protein